MKNIILCAALSVTALLAHAQLSISGGGTGATTAPAALTSLGAASVASPVFTGNNMIFYGPTGSIGHSYPQIILVNQDSQTPSGAGGFITFHSPNSSGNPIVGVSLNGGLVSANAGNEQGDLDMAIYVNGSPQIVALTGPTGALTHAYWGPANSYIFDLGNAWNGWNNLYQQGTGDLLARWTNTGNGAHTWEIDNADSTSTFGAGLSIVDVTNANARVLRFDNSDNAAFSGVITAAAVNAPIVGATNGSAVPAGDVGEAPSSSVPVGSAILLTSGSAVNVASLNLSAGNWLVFGAVNFLASSTTQINCVEGGASATSAAFSNLEFALAAPSPTSGYITSGASIPELIFPVSTPATVYLVARASFSGGSLAVYGFVAALRYH